MDTIADFSDLPEDIMYMVFDYLNFADQLAAGSTCKRWRYVLFSKKVQKNKELRLSNMFLSDTDPPFIYLLENRQPFNNFHLFEVTIEHLGLEMASYISEEAYSLTLDTVNIDLKRFDDLLRHCKQLDSLTIKHCSDLFMSGITADIMSQWGGVMGNICHLALPKNQYLTDYIFYNLTLSIKVLKSLDVSYCPIGFHNVLYLRYYPQNESEASDAILTFKFISQVILQHKKHLKYLNISSTVINNSALKILSSTDDGQLLQLEELHMALCNQLTLKPLQDFLQIQSSLVVLNLGASKCVNNNLLKTLVEHLPRIEKLILDSCKGLTNDGLAFLVQLKHLKYLNISNCKGINGEGIKQHLNQSNDRLQTLKVCYLNLCEDSVKAIACYLRQLRDLDLSYCPFGITDASVHFIIKHLRWLRSLSLDNCFTLTDYAFTGCVISHEYADLAANDNAAPKFYNDLSKRVKNRMSNSEANIKSTSFNTLDKCIENWCSDPEAVTIRNLKGLQTLNLNYCTRITDITIKFGLHLKELRQLHISNCRHITIAGFISLVGNCPSLEEISLCECFQVTDKIIYLITKKLTRLRALHVSGCLQLTELCINYIIQNCRSLKILSIQRCPQLKEKGNLLKVLPTLHQLDMDY